MKLLTFKGGIHPPYNKEYTNQIALKKAEAPKVVYIPLQQHIGAPAKPIVEVGDEVKKGQLIEANLDLVLGNDITSPVAVKEFEKFGVKKVFDKEKVKKQNMAEQLKLEISIMNKLKHENIVNLIEVLGCKSKVSIL